MPIVYVNRKRTIGRFIVFQKMQGVKLLGYKVRIWKHEFRYYFKNKL